MSLPIQSATAQTNGGTATLTLTAAPTVGNILFLVVLGYNGGITPPSGFSLVQANTSDETYNATWLYSKTVASGDGTTWSASSSGDVRMFVLLEMPAGVTATIAHGAAAGDGTTVASSGTITAYTGTGTYYRVFAWEWDNRSVTPSSTSYSYTDTYGSPAFSNNSYYNHAGLVTGGVATGSGTFTLTLSGNVSRPVWMDVVFYLAASGGGGGGSGGGGSGGGGGGGTPTTAPAGSALFFVLELDVFQPGSGSATYALGRGAHPRGSVYLYPVVPQSSDTLRASDAGYRTRASDAGGVKAYPAVIDQAFEIDRHIALEPGQASTATFGSIKLSNLGRRYDAYVQTRNCDSRSVRLLVGSKTWDASRGIFVDPAYTSLAPFFGGTATAWALSETELEIPLKDPTYLADRPLQASTYSGAGGLAGGSDLVGRRIPMVRGGTSSYPVLNVPLTAVDTANLIYQWTDGPGTVVTLYTGGAGGPSGGPTSLWTYDGDVSNIYAGSTPAAGHYRTCNTKGVLQLGSKPLRVLTADVTGAFPTAGAVSSAVALARYVLTETLAQPSSMLDLTSFSAADTAYPFTSGFFVADDTKALDVVQMLLGSIGARLVSTRSGLLSVLVLRKPSSSATPTATLSPLNVINVTPVALPLTLDPPPYRWRVGYNRIWQTQTSDFDAAIVDARKTLISTDYSYAGWVSSAVQTAWLRPNDPDPVPTLLLKQADAQSLANAIGPIFETRPGLYTVEMPIALAASLDLGSIVSLVWPLADLGSGKIGQIVGEQVRSYDASVQFTALA